MVVDFAAGCLGGLAGILVGHPADTVKVRIQNQTPANIRYRGTLNCFVQIVKKESVLGLYKGILAPMYGQIAINAVIFGVHGNVQKKFNLQHGMQCELISGASAGLIESFIIAPVELVKIRMQIQGEGERLAKDICYKDQKYKYSSPADCLKKIYRHENGLRGIYRGLDITLLREVPALSVYFTSYFYLCKLLGAISEDSINPFKLVFCGGTAGIFSWVFTYPQDVIKTRMQVDGMGKTIYKGNIHCAQLIYKEEGFRGFFRGLNATIIRAFPTNGATLATATLFLRYMLMPVH